MSSGLLAVIVLAAGAAGLWLLSHVVEALRPVPATPRSLRWAPEIPIDYLDLGGYKVRYIKAGRGPNLVLLHTLRTQLDLFEKVVPDLAHDFTVHALDYPGHGYSDIPRALYDADFFTRAVEQFLEALDLRDVTLSGVSIGASIALIVAGRRNARVTRVVAINPYDYAGGLGLARSSWMARIITTISRIPWVGETITRLRTFAMVKPVFYGGVVDPANFPPALLREMYEVGNRPRHYLAFIALLRHGASWEDATRVYANITVPVRLVWGAKDWARPGERERDRRLIPGAQMVTIENGGHFLPLDHPRAVIAQLASK